MSENTFLRKEKYVILEHEQTRFSDGRLVEVGKMENEKVLEEAQTMADLEAHFDDANPWNIVKGYLENGTDLHLTVDGIVNGGVIVNVEGIRGFIPASRLSLSYVENLEDYLLKEIDVRVIEADQANNRLVLSAREILREKEKKAKDALIASVEVGSVLSGKVETIQNYGAFIRLDNGLSGLVHVSQISNERIKTPEKVLNVGDEVNVKVIGVKDGKISLSMKALIEVEEEPEEVIELPKAEAIGTSLGDLFKNITL